MSNVFQTVLMTEQRKFWTHRGVQCAVHYHPHTQTMNGYCLIPAGHPQNEIAITAPISGGHTIICWYGNPDQAQELAHALLAANHYKENQT